MRWNKKTISGYELDDKTRKGQRILIKDEDTPITPMRTEMLGNEVILQYLFYGGEISHISLSGEHHKNFKLISPQEAITYFTKKRMDELVRNIAEGDHPGTYSYRALMMREQRDFDTYISCLKDGKKFELEPFSSIYHVALLLDRTSNPKKIGIKFAVPTFEEDALTRIKNSRKCMSYLEKKCEDGTDDIVIRAIPDESSASAAFTLWKGSDYIDMSNSRKIQLG